LIYVYKFFTTLNVLPISEAKQSEKTWEKLLEQNNQSPDVINLFNK
jgi:hypothetical protein